jgi:hypothetical protein
MSLKWSGAVVRLPVAKHLDVQIASWHPRLRQSPPTRTLTAQCQLLTS